MSQDILDQVRQDYSQILQDPAHSILTGDTDSAAMSASVGYTPEELAQQLEIKVEEEGSRADIRFLGQVDGKAVELFSFALNSDAEAEGYVLGTLQDPQHGEIYVVMHMNEQDPEDWSAEGYQQICQRQERVNDFIIQFHEDARFTPKR